MAQYEVGQDVDLLVDANAWVKRTFGQTDREGVMRVAGAVKEVHEDWLLVQPPGTERFVPFAIGVRFDEVVGTHA